MSRESNENFEIDVLGSNHDLEAQSTRSSVECGVPQADFSTIQEAPMSHMVSSTSTNSSCHEYTGIDRSMLDDIEYGNYIS